MTNTQLFAILGTVAGLLAGQTTILLLYINAKIDPVREQVSTLVQYMVSHEGKISRLEGEAKK